MASYTAKATASSKVSGATLATSSLAFSPGAMQIVALGDGVSGIDVNERQAQTSTDELDRHADLECVARACLTPISRNARFVACRRYEFRGARALRSEYAWRKRVQEQPVRPGTLRQDQHTVAVGSLCRRALVDQ